MGLGEIGLLLLAGLGAGVMGSTAGLASLVSYPLLLVVGLPPVTANVTNTVGLVGSSIGSVAGSRPELTGLGPLIRRRAPLAALGGGAGALLLLVGSSDTFEAVVPYLVALASVLILLSPRLRALRGGDASSRQPDGGAGVAVLTVVCCVYGGYFGAAAGVMILALLLSRTDRALPVSNALKNLYLGVANATAAVVFALTAPVVWSAVPPLLVGCIVGGRIGPVVVRRVPPAMLRWTVGLAGIALAVRLTTG